MKNIIERPFMLIIYGPTGVGKTDLALSIAHTIPSEIINMDVGQFYAPLSIGTAKPDWKNSDVLHHLFDIIDTPINYTVNEYRNVLYEKVRDIIKRGKLPILVGGSGFYLHSLLFSEQNSIKNNNDEKNNSYNAYPQNTDLWQELYAIDPQRAMSIDKNDHYRIERALNIWHSTGILPSSFLTIYNPCVDYYLLFIQRDRQELKNRINSRVLTMIEAGWIDEAKNLMHTPWKEFIQKKKLIGYSEIFDYLSGEKNTATFSHMVEVISARTRQYAKRQCTFWRKLEREIKKENQYTGTHIGCLEVLDVTNINDDVYSNTLSQQLSLR